MRLFGNPSVYFWLLRRRNADDFKVCTSGNRNSTCQGNFITTVFIDTRLRKTDNVSNVSAVTFPKFMSVLRVIDRSDRNPPVTATSVTFWPAYVMLAGCDWWISIWSVDNTRLTEILETFPQVIHLILDSSRQSTAQKWTLLFQFLSKSTVPKLWNQIWIAGVQWVPHFGKFLTFGGNVCRENLRGNRSRFFFV